MDFMVFMSEQWVLFAVLAVLVAAVIYVEGKRSGPSLSYHEVTRLLNSDNAVIIDVREASEFKAGHIVDAINIPFAKIRERADELNKLKEKTLVVVDKLGQHSGASSKILKELGFNVNRMQGGMAEWKNQNLPVVKS